VKKRAVLAFSPNIHKKHETERPHMHIPSLDQLVGQDVGAYQVERLLGHGQVNAVYLAYHSTQNSPVALMTFILPEMFSVEARQYFLLRFRKEAARLTALQHPHILPVHDYGEYAGHPYLVTPYMTRGSLTNTLKRHVRFHHTEVLHILQQVVAGLAHAHAKGVFHGALKPSNIVLNNQQQMLVAGFGLMHIIQMRGIEQARRPYAHLFDIAGTFLTSAEYIAPEVVRGQPADARTDIYSLGVILFELLSGKTPFTGTDPLEVAMKHVQQPILSLHTYCPDIPLALATVVNQALDRDPARRFQRVDELLEAFAQVSAGLEQNANKSVRTVQNAWLPETPPAGYELRDWQLFPPIVTDKEDRHSSLYALRYRHSERSLRSTSQGLFKRGWTGNEDQHNEDRRKPPDRGQPYPSLQSSSEQWATSAFRPAPQPVTQSPQEALFDLWTLPPQGSSSPHRLDSARWNAKQAKRHPTRRSRPFEGRKTHANKHLSRRRVVALLVAGGVTIAGTAVAINLTVNASSQQAQNNAAHLAKNAAMNFMNPTDGKASILVHLANGNFVAYDRACTHKGVYVNYDPAQQLLVCPAHGATFDPAQDGAVIQEVPQEPPLKPLPKVTVHINADGTIVAG
jgi:serine/threonine protein kinase/nitrite reductase/ring-hydroxylating ferredoxin subunit